MRSCEPEREAHELVELFTGPDLLRFLSTQLGVVKQHAQMLLGLCGLAVTVTGFSGSHMIRAGMASAVAMVSGIALIMVGAVLSLRVLLRVRWVSQELCEDLEQTATTVVNHRNRQQRRLSVAGVFVATGLAAYLVSVSLAAFSHHTS